MTNGAGHAYDPDPQVVVSGARLASLEERIVASDRRIERAELVASWALVVAVAALLVVAFA